MMGDRDYRHLIKKAVDSIGKDIEPKIEDVKNNKTIYLHEINRCLRRSYYDRVEPIDPKGTSFTNLMSGLLQKMNYGGGQGEFAIEDLKLKGNVDMVLDDAILVFRTATHIPEVPFSSDILYLNGCMWIFNKVEGVIVYMTSDGKEGSFSLNKDKGMFEETIRRVRVFHDLLEEKKVPILEPSQDCSSCQYYERCYIRQKIGRQITLQELLGLKKESKNNK